MLRFVVAAALLHQILAVPVIDDITPRTGEKCGYESCPVVGKNVLNVHIVPHTHDDVGWLKTVDQYYYGSRNNIQKAGVQYILDSVIKELWEDPKRRFVYVETAFFWKWWKQQRHDVKQKVHTLVRQGRLEFIGGAWSMNDEASTHYQSTIDQFTFGLRKLNDTFGACARPRVGWQIDPFGHAREFASLLALMHYDGLFMGRIDYQDKMSRLARRHMEMLWRGDDDLGADSDIFAGVLYNHYSPPSGFCFDVLCDDEPIVDDSDSPMYNVDERIEEFLAKMADMSLTFRSNNVMTTMGDDFHYMDAGIWFNNLDKLIKYANRKAAKENLKVKLFYSTPSCYLKAIMESKPTLPIKQDDFFPYASDPTAYWTGYFTSRPTTKFFERQGNAYLQTVKQLQVLGKLEDHNQFFIHELSDAMGVMQHHDAITGTEKQHVAHDYERLLNRAIDDALSVARQAFNKISQGDVLKTPLLSYDRCMFNQSQCEASENNEQFVITIYNPLGWKNTAMIQIPVVDGEYAVLGPDGKEIKTDIFEITSKFQTIPTRNSKATHELLFVATDLPAMGFRQYYVKKTESRKSKRDTIKDKLKNDFYSHINEYWKSVRDHSYVEIRKLENTKDNAAVEAKKANAEAKTEVNEDVAPKLSTPTRDDKTYVNRDRSVDSDVEMMKDVNEGINEDILQLEKMLKEARKAANLPDDDDKKRDGKLKILMNDEEMRMLSDDPAVVQRLDAEELFIENEHYKLLLNGETGAIRELVLADGTAYQFDLQYVVYQGCVGDNSSPSRRSSGAYIFRPNDTGVVKQIGKGKITKGDLFQQIQYDIEYGSIIVILCKDKAFPYVIIRWVIGVDVADGVGKEIAIRYNVNIETKGQFFTDSNGRQLLRRKLDERPQYNVSLQEPVPGNYYPVTNQITVASEDVRFTVITDRAEGGTSLNDGDVELMVHRRLLHDDAFGVGEALNETAYGKPLMVEGHHYLLVGKTGKETRQLEKQQTINHHLYPQIFVSDATDVGYDRWLEMTNEFEGLTRSLPDGLHLLSLEPWKGDALLLRIENIYQSSDSGEIEVDLHGLLAGIELLSIRETNLAANQWMEGHEKWDWNVEEAFKVSFDNAYDAAAGDEAKSKRVSTKMDDLKLKIAPKQIRTFVVEYRFK